jgi:3-deoxy-7-phosphoheptulonate synthase
MPIDASMHNDDSFSSWRQFPVQQQPTYPDQVKLSEVEKQLRGYPPLVFAQEIRDLKLNLADISDGKGFLLQGW